jgi:acyl-CoA thioesterase
MNPAEITEKMMAHDTFSQLLGVKVLASGLGYSKIQMVVQNTMLNGFGIAHGGITFSLADSCFAFCSNSYGQHAVSIDTSINHLQPVFEGDTLTAESAETNRTRKTGLYLVKVTNQKDELVALFKGMVYVKDKQWIP